MINFYKKSLGSDMIIKLKDENKLQLKIAQGKEK